MNELLYSNRPQDHRRWKSSAKNLHGEVALRYVAQHSGNYAPMLERLQVRTHGAFAPGAPGHVVERFGLQHLHRRCLKLTNRDGNRLLPSRKLRELVLN